MIEAERLRVERADVERRQAEQVPELAPAGRTERAFALFYTGTIGSGAIAPVLYGLLGDALGPTIAPAIVAATALTICPLALGLARYLSTAAHHASP